MAALHSRDDWRALFKRRRARRQSEKLRLHADLLH
jgi:hypothetical protein